MTTGERGWHRDKRGDPCYSVERVPWGGNGWERCAACSQAMPAGFAKTEEPTPIAALADGAILLPDVFGGTKRVPIYRGDTPALIAERIGGEVAADGAVIPPRPSVMDGLFGPKVQTIVRQAPKVGRNDPCPCGSGKKHKKCCLESLTASPSERLGS